MTALMAPPSVHTFPRRGGVTLTEGTARNEIGERVRVLREAQGWSQAELARRAGVGPANISRLESGSTSAPQTGSLRAIANALNVGLDELLGRKYMAPSMTRESSPPAWAVAMPPSGYVPLVQGVAAGPDEMGIAQTGEYVAVPADLMRGRQLVAARVIGTCMEPEIMDGDIAIIDTAVKQPTDGKVVAVLMGDGELMLKRFLRSGGVSVLIDNNGRTYSLDGAVMQGVLVSIQRTY